MIVDPDELTGSFARHETFHPRYGWLRKAYEGACHGVDAFSRPDATVMLGVGKNMVNAIKHWGMAFDLLDEVRLPDRKRVARYVPSALAEAMFSEDGWDPYLEDPASLWLLHWRLLRPPCHAPAWWLAFNGFGPVQFTDEQLLHFIEEIVDSTPEWSRIASSSIKKDVDCVIRMYAPTKAKGRQGLEDILDCPFRDLGLIEPVPDEPRTFRWSHAPKSSLPPEIVAHAAVDFARRTGTGTTVTLTRLATAPGGPGRAFKMPEAQLYEALATAAEMVDGLSVTSPGGIRQLVIPATADDLPMRIVERYFHHHGGSKRRLNPRPPAEMFEDLARVEASLQDETDQLEKLQLTQQRKNLEAELADSGVRY